MQNLNSLLKKVSDKDFEFQPNGTGNVSDPNGPTEYIVHTDPDQEDDCMYTSIGGAENECGNFYVM